MAINKYHTEIDIFRWHQSPEDYLAYLSQDGVRECHFHGIENDNEDWGGPIWPKALEKLERGDATRTGMVNSLYDEITVDLTPTSGRNIIGPAIVGFVPNVPAYLAGQPETMLARQVIEDMSHLAPLRIFVETSVSCNLTATQLINRGVATLAFTMLMNTVRPIELYLLSSWSTDEGYGDGYAGVACHVVRVETKPLDISRAAWMLTDPGYARRLSFSAAKHLMWPKLIKKSRARRDTMPLAWGAAYGHQYVINMEQALKTEPQDLIIVGGYGGNDLMLNDPKAWVNQMIDKHMELMK